MPDAMACMLVMFVACSLLGPVMAMDPQAAELAPSRSVSSDTMKKIANNLQQDYKHDHGEVVPTDEFQNRLKHAVKYITEHYCSKPGDNHACKFTKPLPGLDLNDMYTKLETYTTQRCSNADQSTQDQEMCTAFRMMLSVNQSPQATPTQGKQSSQAAPTQGGKRTFDPMPWEPVLPVPKEFQHAGAPEPHDVVKRADSVLDAIDKHISTQIEAAVSGPVNDSNEADSTEADSAKEQELLDRAAMLDLPLSRPKKVATKATQRDIKPAAKSETKEHKHDRARQGAVNVEAPVRQKGKGEGDTTEERDPINEKEQATDRKSVKSEGKGEGKSLPPLKVEGEEPNGKGADAEKGMAPDQKEGKHGKGEGKTPEGEEPNGKGADAENRVASDGTGEKMPSEAKVAVPGGAPARQAGEVIDKETAQDASEKGGMATAKKSAKSARQVFEKLVESDEKMDDSTEGMP